MVNADMNIKNDVLEIKVSKEVFDSIIKGFKKTSAKIWIPNKNTIEITNIKLEFMINKNIDN